MDLKTQNSNSPQQSTHSEHPFQAWTLEMLSALLAVGVVVAIISILAHFNGQTTPVWRYSINLNTLVALLSTVARALVLITVSEVLGQAKWLWISQRTLRPISHLEHFDVASRGWFGSFRLLTILPRNVLAIVSCLVVVLSLAMGSFTQQAIKTTTCPQNSKEVQASIPIAHHMSFPQGDYIPYRTAPTDLTIPADMKGAMANGLVNPIGNNSAVSGFCPTGNCTFQAASDNTTYSSIGVCSTCIDTTSFVTSAGPDLAFPEGFGPHPEINYTIFPNWTLPNGMWTYLWVTMPLLNISTESLEWASSAFTMEFGKLVQYSITNITVLAFTQATCSNTSGILSCLHNVTGCPDCSTWNYVATSCALYPCLKNYHGSVREGILSEEVVSTMPAQFNWVEAGYNPDDVFLNTVDDITARGNLTALQNPCTIEGREYTAESNYSGMSWSGQRLIPIQIAGTNYTAPEACMYSLDRLYAVGMDDFFRTTFFQTGCIWADETGGEPQCDPAWWLSPLFNSRQATFESISTAFNRFATIVTNRFRSTGSNNNNPSQTETAKGIVVETAVCTVFNWEWLLLPILLVIVTVLLLGYMVAQSLSMRSQPVWKTSILPLLFYNIKGLETPTDKEPRAVADLDRLRKRARHIRVRWQGGANAGFSGDGETGKTGTEDQEADLDSLLISDDQASCHT